MVFIENFDNGEKRRKKIETGGKNCTFIFDLLNTVGTYVIYMVKNRNMN